MNCPQCSSNNPEVARFCLRCGDTLSEGLDRNDHFAAHPGEPVRALALISTLLPHVSGHRHSAYRFAIGTGALLALAAAGLGYLPVALVSAAVTLPTVLIVYLHDHSVWDEERLSVLGLCVVVAGLLGVGVGLIAVKIHERSALTSLSDTQPRGRDILLLAVLTPVLALIALQVGPVLATLRPSLHHPLDAVALATLSAAAFALTESLTVQHDAFSRSLLHSTDASRDLVVALTLGLVKPVLYATAAGLAVVRLRQPGASYPLGLLEGLLLLLGYDLALTLLNPYGSRGVVMTLLAALALASMGLLRLRTVVHQGLLAEALAAVREGGSVRVAEASTSCPHCQLPLVEGAAFCLVCGTSMTATAKPSRTGRSAGVTARPATA